MAGMTLTEHQQQAVEWIVQRVLDGQSLMALRGLAGTGKTTVIPALREALAQHDLPAVVGSPTHRAAMILRKKGIVDADTVHAHALTPYFKADYRRAAGWLGEELPCRPDDQDAPHADSDGLPWLVWDAVQPDLAKGRDLRRRLGRHPANKLLASLGINGKDHFAGFGPKTGHGVLIIDEASMVGSKMLAICEEAFRQIVLIGDPGQLPPVKDDAMLAKLEGTDLTEIHRQASDSPIIQLAYRARQGEPFWQQKLARVSTRGAITELSAIEATEFLESPLIVWRNVTRIASTHDIRHALGHEKSRLYVGEPLVCRSTSQEDRAEGFYNNGLYRITAVCPDDPRRITVEDPLGHASTILAHVEELDGDGIDPRAIPFRFGFCLTAHTAQGGEWSTVYVSKPDLLKYAGFCGKTDRQHEIAQWTYTAITRAKTTLCFLTQHQFVAADERKDMPAKVSPPSAPLLGNAPGPGPLITSPIPDPDDIADPPVPPAVTQAITPASAAVVSAAVTEAMTPTSAAGVSVANTAPLSPPTPAFQDHEALLVGFCAVLQQRVQAFMLEEHKGIMQTLDATLVALRKWVETVGARNEHSEYQLSDTLLKLQERGLALRHDPYTATVAAVSPAGFEVSIRVAKQDTAELVTALPALLAWLAAEGFTPVPRGSLAGTL